ncbi:MAG: tRNA (adenosine(37)-N6)-threonylcarbamoyltransferase complex transferase subunit TsaD [Alphaproteobacteria bacterium]|nr:tRNA (adenosine(37)-N6)-threonylcarbamoyltransferase complex transferase subunit TsaD [Alphaproteobacteria bacterium]
MIVLGLETSCDETAAAVVDDARRIRAEAVFGQEEVHRPWGGVVPELAARSHVERLDLLVARVLARAGLRPGEVGAIAATAGPGLIGGVMVGLTFAKAMAAVLGKPLVAVNHLEGHALTARLTNDLAFPYLLLLASGGHCQILLVEGVGRYRRLGTTIDDAVGECFDKSAKLLGLGYPGGPAIERAAASGNPQAFALPRPMLGRSGCDFSFSGLKTAVRQLVEGARTSPEFVADVAASLQAAIADVVADRLKNALDLAAEARPTALVAAGGVAANLALRMRLGTVADGAGLPPVVPPVRLCTDNAVMIAWAGVERLALGLADPLDIAPRARWPLDPKSEPRH